MLTTFWCGPPLKEFDDRRAAEIVEAGFTVVGPLCEGAFGAFDPVVQAAALDVAARHGLKMWIADPRFDGHARSRPEWESQAAAAVDLYKGHEALGGYFVTDEPNPNQFDDLAAMWRSCGLSIPVAPCISTCSPTTSRAASPGSRTANTSSRS
jgi:hypothetical protein